MSLYRSQPIIKINQNNYIISQSMETTGSDNKGRLVKGGLEFIPGGQRRGTESRPGQDGIPHGASSIYEITCSAVSMSGLGNTATFLQTRSIADTSTSPGSFIQISADGYQQLNLLFISSSVSGSNVRRMIASRYRFYTASYSPTDMGKVANVATQLHNAIAAPYSQSKSALDTPSDASKFPNVVVKRIPDSQTGSNNSYTRDVKRINEPFVSASLPQANVVRIVLQYTGSSKIRFNPELTSSFGFTINETRVGFGSYYQRQAPIGATSASFRFTLADEVGDGLMLTALDNERARHELPSGVASVSGTHSPVAYFSSSGHVGIGTEDPGVHLEVSGSISASGDIHGFSGSFQYITASIVDVDGDTIRMGGETFNKTLLQNVKDGFDSDTRETGGATFKGGVKSRGSITASGDISASGNFLGSNIGPIYGNYIYLTPTDFAVDSAMAADGTITFDGGGIKDGGGRLKYFAQKVIPKGYKATRYKLFGSDALGNTNAYSSSYNEPSASATLGSSKVGTEKVLTGSIVGGEGTYISITWGARGLDELYGGYIKIERID